ncbi:MAG: type II toxin-antitoxin system RelB/DinJ family antitoxin [Planctomycetes bacterium]|nr:type II toxin-antitoxin system RelB/DinJ family antitoxin [Planctomycetota bacterium]MBM4080824.1 type II toxin-antitoxin system RelB/DinJ family antitoxin [Planctomycetota bacterium]MBM4085869.1 type II toxin-antitoxin system RelB/DinJ family antitoxin [Planctomycetota bacterium]
MNKSSLIRARIESRLKEDAENIFRRLGVSTAQAIAIFYRQVTLRKGLPFNVVIPNETTRKTLEATDSGRDVILCKDAEDMFRKLGI